MSSGSSGFLASRSLSRPTSIYPDAVRQCPLPGWEAHIFQSVYVCTWASSVADASVSGRINNANLRIGIEMRAFSWERVSH